MHIDKLYINVSLFILRLIKGRTFPNPPVVSLLVETSKDGSNSRIINFGITAVGGRPHAEAKALKNFDRKVNKSYILYSTLEPCCHEGRGKPCAQKILKSKIDRVVFSLLDPDKRMRGNGMKILKENGLKVRFGLMEKEAYEIYKGYFFNRIKSRPMVSVKLATSLDGKIAIRKNSFTQITQKDTQKYLHILRSEYDAILVGSNTVKIDDCKLNSRIEGLEKFSPIRVILNRELDLQSNRNVFKNCKKFRTIIFTQKKKSKKMKLLLNKGVEIICVEKKNYNLNYFLRELANKGICNLLVEGGAKVFQSFLSSEFCDKVLIFRGNYFIGADGQDALAPSKNKKKYDFNLKSIIKFNNDHLEIFESEKENLILR